MARTCPRCGAATEKALLRGAGVGFHHASPSLELEAWTCLACGHVELALADLERARRLFERLRRGTPA